GYNHFTMLQLAHATAMLANHGIQHRPHLGKGTVDAVTRAYSPLYKDAGTSMGYKPEHVEAVRSAVAAVTVEGTARGVFGGAPYTSAGKTGTAQAVSVGQKDKYNAAKLAEHQRDHSLYIAYAPAENPKIALAVIVENAGFGAAAAAPIARRVFDYWLLDQYPSVEDMAAVRKGQASRPSGVPRSGQEMMAAFERMELPGLGAPRVMEGLSGGDMASPRAPDTAPASLEPEAED